MTIHRFPLGVVGGAVVVVTAWLVLGVLAGGCANGASEEASIAVVERQFRDLPMESRRLTGPLFWLHGDESRERLETYVEKVAEGGNGSFTAESRPHNDWLGEGWYRDLAICLEAAKKHDLKLWIFDEKWWPSGEVGGKVPPQYGCKTMTAEATTVEGPVDFTSAGNAGPHFIALLAGKESEGGIDGGTLVDLAPSIDGNGRLVWKVPPGRWKVMKFGWKHTGGERILVDGASQDCVDWYIDTVYRPHHDRFKADFGKTIAGYFYDEPETPGDWGTEVPKLLAERKIDWKKAYVAWKFRLAGEEQAAARYQYQDALAEAWGRTLYGGITRWCRERNVRSIGHFLEHRNDYLNPRLCAGNMVQLQKYSDMGAIDAVFRQFAMGKRVANDAPCWQTPKLGSSISHAYGKADDVAMVEIYGARGQDLSYPEMKWWLDHMQVSGINFIIPHSFNPRAPYDTDCPPYFYNGGYEPRWPLYRVFADYSSRLTHMLTGGRHVCPVAVLYLGNSRHVGKSVTPEQISEALQDALYDCDWLPYDVFEADVAVSNESLRLRGERYRVLVVPPVEVIPPATLRKVKAFFDAGGVVLAHGFLPSKSASLGGDGGEIKALCDAVWGESPAVGESACRVSRAGGRSYLLPQKPTAKQLQQVLAGDAGVRPTLEVVAGETSDWLHVLHRVKAGRDVFFVCNQNADDAPRKFRLKIKADGHPECWDAMRNEITRVSYERQGGHVFVDLTLDPLESLLLVFMPQARDLPARIESDEVDAGAVRTIALDRVATPSTAAVVPEPLDATARSLEGCSWVWYPEGNPAAAAPPATRYFRRTVEMPAAFREARFLLSADNSFVLYVNGEEAGRGAGWQTPTDLDLTRLLKPGRNVVAIEATNASDHPNPAGVIGRLAARSDGVEPMRIDIDSSWKCSTEKRANWNGLDCDDDAAAGWTNAVAVADFGQGPWGKPGEGITRSPIAAVETFEARCELSESDLIDSRVYLRWDEVAPEAAGRVTVNGRYAGGVIGRPFRIDVTRHMEAGTNEVSITPFAPRSASLVIIRKESRSPQRGLSRP